MSSKRFSSEMVNGPAKKIRMAGPNVSSSWGSPGQSLSFCAPQKPYVEMSSYHKPAAASPYFKPGQPARTSTQVSDRSHFQQPTAQFSRAPPEPQKVAQPSPQKTFPSAPEPSKILRILTGNVEKVLTTWSRITRNEPILYEVYGRIDHVRGNVAVPVIKKFFMSDFGANGPQLLVEFCEIDRPLVELDPGDVVRVVGAMHGRVLQAYTVEKSSAEAVDAIQRVFHVCDRTVAEMARLK